MLIKKFIGWEKMEIEILRHLVTDFLDLEQIVVSQDADDAIRFEEIF